MIEDEKIIQIHLSVVEFGKEITILCLSVHSILVKK